jgi:TP901 family phage tail tape measure protein
MASNVIATLLIKIGVQTQALTKSLKKIEGEMKGFEGTLKKHGAAAARSFTVAAVGIGTALGYAAKHAVKFEDEMNRVGTVTAASASQMQKMKDMVMNLSETYGVSSHEIAKGMEEMARRGFDAEKIMKAFPSILKATIASGEDFNTVLRTTESLLLEFQMSADETGRVADVLSKAAVLTAANFSRMGEAFKYSAPVAYQLGINLQDLAAATGIMINAGIQGSSAGRLLGSALLRLARPPEMAAKALEKLNVQIKDEHQNMLPLNEIIRQLHDSTKDMGNVQRIAALEMIFGKEAVKALLPVIEKGPAVFDKLSASLENSGGKADELAKKMGQSVKAQWNRLKASVENLAILFGNTLLPALNKVLDKVQSLVRWFKNLSPTTKKVITFTLQWAASLFLVLAAISKVDKAIKYIIGPIRIIQSLFGVITRVVGAAGAAGAVGILGRAFSLLGGPIGIAIGALSLLFPVISKLKDKYNEAKKKLEEEVKPKPIKIQMKIEKPSKTEAQKQLESIFGPLTKPIPGIQDRKEELSELDKSLRDLAKTNKDVWGQAKKDWNEAKTSWGNFYNEITNKLTEYINKHQIARNTVHDASESQKKDLRDLSAVGVDALGSLSRAAAGVVSWFSKLIGLKRSVTSIKLTPELNRRVFGPTFGVGGNTNAKQTYNTFNISANSVNGRHIQNFMNRKSSSMFGGGF